MDDLNEKITRLLSSPEGMAKIQSAMAALSGGVAEAAAPVPTAASAMTAPTVSAPPPSAGNGGGIPDLAALTKLLPLLSGMGQDNEDTRLLQALRPYLHGQREQRLDDTMRLLRLARLLPLLQEQGILKHAPGGSQGGNGHGG